MAGGAMVVTIMITMIVVLIFSGVGLIYSLLPIARGGIKMSFKEIWKRCMAIVAKGEPQTMLARERDTAARVDTATEAAILQAATTLRRIICPHCFSTRPIDQSECALGCNSYIQPGRLYYSSLQQAEQWSDTAPPPDGMVMESDIGTGPPAPCGEVFHAQYPQDTAPTPIEVDDIVRDLQGEHGISWTHAAAFIKLVEGCGCCSERLRMVLDRLFQIATPEEKEDVE